MGLTKALIPRELFSLRARVPTWGEGSILCETGRYVTSSKRGTSGLKSFGMSLKFPARVPARAIAASTYSLPCPFLGQTCTKHLLLVEGETGGKPKRQKLS